MDQFFRIKDNELFYTDTDSAFLQKELPENMVDPVELGKMKLEHQVKDSIFISPKIYYITNSENKTFIKSKGFSYDVISKEKITQIYKNAKNFLLEKPPFLTEDPPSKKTRFKVDLKNIYDARIYKETSPLQIKNLFNKSTPVFDKEGNWISMAPLKLTLDKNKNKDTNKKNN